MLTPSLFNENFDLFDHYFDDPWWGFNDHEFKNLEKKLYGHRAKNVMNTDIKESENDYEMTIDLPGFKKDEVSVELENGYLTIAAHKGFEKGFNEGDENAGAAAGKGATDQHAEAKHSEAKEKAKKARYIRQERYTGSCQRSFFVGEDLETKDIKANFEHGILKLVIPKKEKKEVASNKYIAIEG